MPALEPTGFILLSVDLPVILSLSLFFDRRLRAFVNIINLQLTSIEERPSVRFIPTSKVLYLKHIKLV